MDLEKAAYQLALRMIDTHGTEQEVAERFYALYRNLLYSLKATKKVNS
jgi:hypothetical protein